ncbi:MAG: S-layer homology domain-containing protein [Clostridia bacterium]|nr:S-layer homology domain-containing protein [Clostridia bacterium]
MKITNRIVSLLMVALFLQILFVVPIGAENLIGNGDFDVNIGDWKENGAVISRETENAFGGSGASAKVELTEPRGYVYQTITLKKGTEYWFSAYAKLAKGTKTVQFIVDRNKGNEVLQVDYVAVGTQVTTDWTKIMGRYTYNGENEEEAKIYLRFGDGLEKLTYYFDNFIMDSEAPKEMVHPLTDDAEYRDVARNHWARNYILAMDKKGIVHGVGENTFLPEGNVTRAEFLAMLVRALQLKSKSYDGVYQDVKAEDWYAGIIQTAVSDELIDEAMTADNNFLPNQPITREEIASLVVKAYQYLELEEPGLKEGNHSYDDVSSWAKDYVRFAESVGLIRGDSEGMRPKDKTTRAEATAIIQRLLEKQKQTIYYVDSETGDDKAKGTEFEPLKTIEGVKALLRTVNRNMKHDIYVYLCNDTYTLTETLTFDAKDSGTNGYNIIYMGAKGKMPVISGGVQVTDWTLYDAEKNIYSAKANGLDTRQLYINGKRGVRARSEGGLTNAVTDKGVRGLISDDTFLADFEHPEDMEMVFHGDWTHPRVGVKEILVTDGKADIVLRQPAWYKASNKGATSVRLPWWYENAYELLDSEGEWFLDKRTDTFYYKPYADEDMETADVIAPVLEQLMVIEGRVISEPVHNISFKNLKFEHTGWLGPNTDYGHVDTQCNYWNYTEVTDIPDGQALLFPGAIEIQRGNNINFVECEFSKMGIGGLQYIRGMQDCVVVGNHFYDISGTAVQIGHPDDWDVENINPTDSRMVMRGFTVDNNYIHDIAVEYYSAVGIAIGYVADSTFNHNEIYNVPYSGFHIGYGWDRIKTSATKNVRVQYNYVHEVMTKLLDGGAIYTIGGTGGSEDNYNLITDNYLKNQHDASMVLYSDSGSSYWWWEKNVVSLEDSRWPRGSQTWANVYDTNPRYRNFTPVTKMYGDGDANRDKLIMDTQVYPDENWPDEAMEVIRNSGVEDKYKYLVPINYDFDKITTTASFDMQIGDQGEMNLKAFTDRGMPYDISGAEISYVSENPEVVSVDAEGHVVALSQGMTNIITTFVLGDITRTRTTTVKVQDEFDKIYPEKELTNYMLVGASKTVKIVGETTFGTMLELDSVEFTSSNPSVLSVVNNEKIIAMEYGDAELTVKGKYNGEEREFKHNISVITYGDDSALGYPEYPFNELKNGTDGWFIAEGALLHNITNGVKTETPKGQVLYTAKKFGDELLTFDMKVNSKGGWYGIVFRSQNTTGYDAPDQACYMITFGDGGTIDLTRFNNGKRTGIFESSVSDNNIGGIGRQNDFIKMGQTHKVQLGAVNEDGGVRIIVNVDGVNVFNYLDTTEGRIENPGYFGVYNRTGTIDFTAE